MSAPELKRYMVPCGHGIEEHPAGLLHRREDVDKAIAEARREALREARDNISGSCWAMPSNGGTRSYNRGVQDSLSVIDALLDAEAPAQPKPDAVQEATPMNSELDRLIEKARQSGPMTDAEDRAQKISFAYGQLMNAAPNITKEEIARMLDKMEGHDDD